MINSYKDLRPRGLVFHVGNFYRWEDADAIRECLLRANVLVEDTPEGSRWRLQPPADTSIGESGAKGARR